MRLTKEDLYYMCGDFKDLVKGKYFDSNMTDLDLKLLNTKDCVIFFKEKRIKEHNLVKREEVTNITRDSITIRFTKSVSGKIQEMKDIIKPLTELKNYLVLLGPNKVVMSEIGRFYSNK